MLGYRAAALLLTGYFAHNRHALHAVSRNHDLVQDVNLKVKDKCIEGDLTACNQLAESVLTVCPECIQPPFSFFDELAPFIDTVENALHSIQSEHLETAILPLFVLRSVTANSKLPFRSFRGLTGTPRHLSAIAKEVKDTLQPVAVLSASPPLNDNWPTDTKLRDLIENASIPRNLKSIYEDEEYLSESCINAFHIALALMSAFAPLDQLETVYDLATDTMDVFGSLDLKRAKRLVKILETTPALSVLFPLTKVFPVTLKDEKHLLCPDDIKHLFNKLATAWPNAIQAPGSDDLSDPHLLNSESALEEGFHENVISVFELSMILDDALAVQAAATRLASKDEIREKFAAVDFSQATQVVQAFQKLVLSDPGRMSPTDFLAVFGQSLATLRRDKPDNSGVVEYLLALIVEAF